MEKRRRGEWREKRESGKGRKGKGTAWLGRGGGRRVDERGGEGRGKAKPRRARGGEGGGEKWEGVGGRKRKRGMKGGGRPPMSLCLSFTHTFAARETACAPHPPLSRLSIYLFMYIFTYQSISLNLAVIFSSYHSCSVSFVLHSPLPSSFATNANEN